MQLADRLNEPRLTQWDAWGNRIDQIELTPLWRRAERSSRRARTHGDSVRAAHGRFSRVHQFALVYLFHPSTDVYTCPLAMTDGAARTLLESRQRELVDARRAAPHQPRPGDVLDQRPVDDRGDRRLRRRASLDHGGAASRTALAAVRHEVVHLRRDLADGADAGAARGQRAGRQRAGAVLRRDARRGRTAATASASTASRTSSARARCRPPS